MTTTTTRVAVAVVIVVAVVVVAAVMYVRRCLAVLEETPDVRLRYLTRAGWTAVIICVIPIGGMMFLGYGRDA